LHHGSIGFSAFNTVDIVRKGSSYLVLQLCLRRSIVELYQNYTWKTEVLAASLRHPIHVIEAARLGADIATMPFKVIEQLFNHPLTDKGQAQFLADWAKSGRK